MGRQTQKMAATGLSEAAHRVALANKDGHLASGVDLDAVIAERLVGLSPVQKAFMDKAANMPLDIAGRPELAVTKVFSSGRIGWYLSGKITLDAPTGVRKGEWTDGKVGDLAVKFPNGTEVAMAKNFSTGSVGWYLNGKTPMKVNDGTVWCQCGMSITVVDSKLLGHNDLVGSRVTCQLSGSFTIIGSKPVA